MKQNKPKNRKTLRNAIVLNIVGGLGVWLLMVALNNNPHYNFTFKMLSDNYTYIDKYKDKPMAERYVMKLKHGYNVFKNIAERTPKDAVIYLPDGKAFTDDAYDFKVTSDGSVPYIKGLATRFLYPRRVVLESEYKKDSKYNSEITHVVIINKRGAELLPNFDPESLPIFGIIPVTRGDF